MDNVVGGPECSIAHEWSSTVKSLVAINKRVELGGTSASNKAHAFNRRHIIRNSTNARHFSEISQLSGVSLTEFLFYIPSKRNNVPCVHRTKRIDHPLMTLQKHRWQCLDARTGEIKRCAADCRYDVADDIRC